MTRISIFNGTEGPAHDPYGYEVITVTRGGYEYEYESHALGEDVFRFDGIECMRGDDAVTEFSRCSGAGPGDWIRWHYRSKARCVCGGTEFNCMQGYPGESFEVCARCGAIIDSHMDWSAIV